MISLKTIEKPAIPAADPVDEGVEVEGPERAHQHLLLPPHQAQAHLATDPRGEGHLHLCTNQKHNLTLKYMQKKKKLILQ